jgi:peptidoglycan/xylan/chitin deacetylase (PgdA/CDA1 family)
MIHTRPMPSNPRIPYELASRRRRYAPLNGKPLLVHLVVNIENWQFDSPMPRVLLPPPHGLAQPPDVPNFSWAEYGMRCGMPRILKALKDRRLPASCALNAGAIETYRACLDEIRDAGWEMIGHGLHQRSLQAETDEGALIHRALDLIAAFAGTSVQGWLGPGLRESAGTPDLLKAAGIRFVYDWVLDDLPCWMATAHGPLLAMPYTLEINDSVIYAVEKHTSDEIYKRLVDTLACLDAELPDQPRILTIGLHPHLIGVPHRFVYLERMLDSLLARPDTLFVTGSQIADWFVAQEGPDHGT